MKPPEPLYPCHFCNEEYSWPASDLHWSNRFSDWVCGECWCDNCHDDDYEPDEMGVRLSDYLKETTEQELAALRAKAKMVDDGFEDAYVVTSVSGRSVSIDFTEARAWSLAERLEGIFRCDLESSGYTCRKVRVCMEVEKD